MDREDARASGSTAMKITRRSSITTPAVSDGASAKGGAAQSSAGAGATDSVELSGAARLLQRLRAEVGDIETTGVDRVAALQQRVDAGEYHPPGREVAERLLTELASDALA